METRSSTRKGKLRRFTCGDDTNGSSSPIDRISELPDAVIHHILTLLPTKTVAQTSVLSKRWRSLWHTFPDLVFDFSSDHFSPSKRFTQNSIYSPEAYYDGVTDPISQFFNLRDKASTSSTTANSADIRSLRVRTTSGISFSRLNDVIRRAVRHNVQQLDLDVITDEHIVFPRSIILSKSLRSLSLKSRCSSFRFPPDLSIMKSGFRSLVSLSLSNVVLIDNDHRLLDLFSNSSFPMMRKLSMHCCLGLKHLRIGCEALEEFELKCCICLLSLEICCPKLETLKVQTCFEEYNDYDDNDDDRVSWVKIEAPKLKTLVWEENAVTDSSSLFDLRTLEEASIGTVIGFCYHENVSLAKLQSLSDFLAGLAYIRRLKFGESNFLEILSHHLYLRERLNPFENLRTLELHIDVKNDTVYGGLACIFRSSPMLQTLILKYVNKIERKRRWKSDESFDSEEFWESQAETLKLFFHHLKIVRIHGVFKCEKEVRLPQFLLRHGKSLQEMTLCITQHLFYNKNILAQVSPRRQNIFRSRVMEWPRASSNATITIR